MRNSEAKNFGLERQARRNFTHRKETALLRTRKFGTVNPNKPDQSVYESLVSQGLLKRVTVRRKTDFKTMYQLSDRMKVVLDLILDQNI